LGEIAVWIGSVDGSRSPIYVLDRIAGIGKSTIAQTVAERAAALDYLGASFFFSRNEEERKNGKLFFGTIAFQLSQYDHEFATRIGMALEHTRCCDEATAGSAKTVGYRSAPWCPQFWYASHPHNGRRS